MLQKAGGLFALLAEADFGSSYGLKSLYYKTRTSNVASSGQVRFARPDVISWRNQANSANLDLAVDSSDNLTFNGVPVVGSFTVSDTSTIDLTLLASVLSADIKNNSITNAMINSSAAIDYSKLNLASSIVNSDISNSAAIAYSKLNLASSIVNADISNSAAIAYSKLNLATSIVNADISAGAAIAYSKLNLASSIVNADISNSAAIAYSKLAALTASRALVSDGLGVVTAATTTATEIGYVNGVTSAIQAQLDSKQKKFYYAKYRKNTSASTSSGSPVDFDTSVYDPNSLVTTGASWKFTAPVDGYAVFRCYMTAASGTNSTYVHIYKNGSAADCFAFCPNVGTEAIVNGGGGTIPLSATEYFDIRCITTTNVSGAAITSGNTSWIAIEFYPT